MSRLSLPIVSSSLPEFTPFIDVPATSLEPSIPAQESPPNLFKMEADVPSPDIPSLLARLNSDEDAIRKMAVFKLQSSINDPAVADLFIVSGGLNILRRLIMSTGGNTLAYSLQSLSRILEVDMGWDMFEQNGAGDLVERLVELIVTHPLVNILRGAMSILVAIVSHPQSSTGRIRTAAAFGFRALKPAIAVYPKFFERVAAQLSSADHALCANALMLLNAVVRDALTGTNEGTQKEGKGSVAMVGTGEDWAKLIKKLMDMGVVQTVYGLMQSSSLQDLALPLLEFQALMKVMFRKWGEMRVDLEKPEHRRALKGLHLGSAPEKKEGSHSQAGSTTRSEDIQGSGKKGSRRHNPEKWRRLGFETETPSWEFEDTGFLGMMDLTEYTTKHEDEFQKLLLEQSTKPVEERCPIARASIAVTTILYGHFKIAFADVEDTKASLVLDGMRNYDSIFRPLLLQWARLHLAGLHSFFRLWKLTGAQLEDFDKIAALVNLLIEQVAGLAPRTKDIADVEEDIADFEYTRLRELQMEILDVHFEEQWGPHLRDVRIELKNEATIFAKEQRTRCLLLGAWFPRTVLRKGGTDPSLGWRFLRLSHNRRYLHYANFSHKLDQDPTLEMLNERIDILSISSVSSNISAVRGTFVGEETGEETDSVSTGSTLKSPPDSSPNANARFSKTRITINTLLPLPKSSDAHPLSSHNPASKHQDGSMRERPLLTIYPLNSSIASDWLDGLLLLLDQTPLTTETERMLDLVQGYGLKVRLLNVRMVEGEDESAWVGGWGGCGELRRGVVPSREGVGEDYWYAGLC